MRYPKLILVSSALAAFFCSGCATMFHNKQELDIVGPPNLQVQNVHGGPIPSYSDAGGLILYPDPARTDSIQITYGTKSTTVALAKNPNGLEFLNLLSFGIGFSVDDLSHSSFNYSPVYVTVDSGASGLKSISASSTNWLGETPGQRDFYGLFLLGTGFAFQTGVNGSEGGVPVVFGLGHIQNLYYTLQTGLGIDYRKQLELFYLLREEPFYGISPDGTATSEIDAGDLCLRWFFHNNLFVQGSYGEAYAPDNDDNEIYNPSTGEYIYGNGTTPSFNEVGGAIGWAGDISYISLQYFTGLSTFNTPTYSNVHYHTVYLNFGLNFRL